MHGNVYRANNPVSRDSPKSTSNAETKFAKSLSNSLNVASFNYSTFAYAFVQNASGPVIRNFFRMFEAICEVLIERVELDMSSNDTEYECGIAASRIRDALQNYKP